MTGAAARGAEETEPEPEPEPEPVLEDEAEDEDGGVDAALLAMTAFHPMMGV
jgi:hypothetical protein